MPTVADERNARLDTLKRKMLSAKVNMDNAGGPGEYALCHERYLSARVAFLEAVNADLQVALAGWLTHSAGTGAYVGEFAGWAGRTLRARGTGETTAQFTRRALTATGEELDW